MKNLSFFLIFFIAIVISIISCNQEDTSTGSNNPVTNHAPNKPNNPYPADSSVNIDTNIIMVLRWQCADPDAGDTLTFDLYAGNELPISTVPVATGLSNTSFGLGVLSASTNYFWQVVAKDNHGAYTSSNVWRFRTRNRQ